MFAAYDEVLHVTFGTAVKFNSIQNKLLASTFKYQDYIQIINTTYKTKC